MQAQLNIHNNTKIPTLWIIIPCYNEQEVLPETMPMFIEELEHLIKLNKISDKSKILYVNDGSKDSTWNMIKEYSEKNTYIIGISQSRAVCARRRSQMRFATAVQRYQRSLTTVFNLSQWQGLKPA